MAELGDSTDRLARWQAQAEENYRLRQARVEGLRPSRRGGGLSGRVKALVRGLVGPSRSRWLNLVRVAARAVEKRTRQTVCSLLAGGRFDPGPAPSADADEAYLRWMAWHEPGAGELHSQCEQTLPRNPLFTLLLPDPGPDPAALVALLESLGRQTYPRWELIAGAEAGIGDEIREVLDHYTAVEARVRVVSCAGGWASCANTLRATARGDFVGALEPAAELPPFALFELARTAGQHRGADLIYADEDELDETGALRRAPWFKPAWSPDTLRSHDCVGKPALFRRDFLTRLGGYRNVGGAEEYDLLLRAGEQAGCVVHVPCVLYHRRGPRPAVDARPVLREHLTRCGLRADVLPGPAAGTCRVRYHLSSRPLISILIPNKDHADDLERCLASLNRSSYLQREVVIVENNSTDPDTFCAYERLTDRPGVRLVVWPRRFNYSAINNFAARHASGEVLLFLNNDVELLDEDWLDWMLGHALRPETGVVGAKLLYPDGTVQHAGLQLGLPGGAGHGHLGSPGDSAGDHGRLIVTQNVSAVTGACLMIRREVFEEVGGFDEGLPVSFNDVDLCLKVRAQGYRVVWTPDARLVHHESRTRGRDTTWWQIALAQSESRRLLSRWPACRDQADPYYSPNLTHQRTDFTPHAGPPLPSAGQPRVTYLHHETEERSAA
jgi:GT2 family glycosyltransferase